MEIQHTVLDNESTHWQRRRDKSSLVGHGAKQDAVSDSMISLFSFKKITKGKKKKKKFPKKIKLLFFTTVWFQIQFLTIVLLSMQGNNERVCYSNRGCGGRRGRGKIANYEGVKWCYRSCGWVVSNTFTPRHLYKWTICCIMSNASAYICFADRWDYYTS